MHHIIISLPISGPSLKSIRNYATLTDVNIRPGSPGARSSGWSKHNSEYTMTRPGRAAQKAFSTFTHLSAFYAFAKKIKNIFKANFG